MDRSGWRLILGHAGHSQNPKRRARSGVGGKRVPSFDCLEERTLMSGGVLDPSFDTDGKVTTDIAAGVDQAKSVAIQPNGKIVVAGVTNNDFAVARYNSDGSLDTSFGTGGIVTIDFAGHDDRATSVVIQPDGMIIVAGVSINGGSGDFAVARLDALGNLDTSFDTDGKVTTDFGGGDDRANSAALQPDGKIVLAGFAGIAGGTDFAVARYNTDGSLDPNFDADGRVTTDFVGSTVAFTNSSATALADSATTISTIPVNRSVFIADLNVNINIAHPNANDLDIVLRHVPSNTSIVLVNDVASGGANFQATSFDDEAAVGINDPANIAPYTGFFRPVGSLAAFDGFDAQGDWQLELTDDTGNAVTGVLQQWTLLITPATIDQGNAVAIQLDGRIVVAGATDAGEDNDFALVRYNADGSLDTTFDTDGMVTTDFSTSNDAANAVAVQRITGRIVAAGKSDSGGGGDNFALANYASDGSLNTSFSGDGKVTSDFASGNDQAFGVRFQSNSKIVVAGVADATGDNDFALALFKLDGSFDSSFGTGGMVLTDFASSSNDQAFAIALQSDGKIVAAGSSGNDFAVARYSGEGPDILVTGADAGTSPTVHVYDAPTLAERFSFPAYPATFHGGVRVAAGDFNGDGSSDIVVAPGAGMEPTVRVLDGRTGLQIPGPVGSFLAYGATFRGGVQVAVGDVNNDGTPDIITGPDKGMEPRVNVINGATGAVIHSFLAFAARFRGGVRVAAADMSGDGRDDVIAGAGPGGSPEVRIFDGATGLQFPGRDGSIIVFNPGFRGGVFVAAGDVNGDGLPDILVGAGRVAPRVKVFSGLDNSVINDFSAYASDFRRGVRVAALDVNGDGRDEIIIGSGPGQGPLVKVFDASLTSLSAVEVDSFFTDELDFKHGVFVGATRRR